MVGVNRLQGLLDAFADPGLRWKTARKRLPHSARTMTVHPVIDHSLRQFHALTHLAPVGILELDEHWVCVHCNERWCEMSQLDLEHSLGDTGWVDVLHSTDVFQTLVTMRETLATGRTFRRELRLQTQPGSYPLGGFQRHCDARCEQRRPVRHPDRGGRHPCRGARRSGNCARPPITTR